MEPFEIYDAEFRFNECDDQRPWLVVDKRKDLVGCLPISGEHYDAPHFELAPEAVGFDQTGLSKRCYILDERLFEIRQSCFARRRGALVEPILTAFREYAGL